MKMPSEIINIANNANEPRKRILIVDDEQSILNALAQVLNLVDSNISVDVASSAEQALRALESQSVDVVITDLMLPQMNGLDLSKTIREKSPDTKLILMTAYGNEFIKQQARNNGCLAYIEKPFEIDQIISCLSDAFAPKVKLHLALRKFLLSDVIKLFDLKQESGSLRLTIEGKKGIVSLQKGVIVDAKFNSETGANALSQIIGASEMTIEDTEQSTSGIKSLFVTWEDVSIAEQIASAEMRIKFLSKTLKSESNSNSNGDSLTGLHADISDLLNEDDTINQVSLVSKTLATVKLNVEHAPDAVDRFINAGVAHFNEKRFEQARLCWQLALKLNPKSESASKNLSILADFLP